MTTMSRWPSLAMHTPAPSTERRPGGVPVRNVAYPVIDAEVLRFCAGKRAVLMGEEGQPNFIEQNVATILRHFHA